MIDPSDAMRLPSALSGLTFVLVEDDVYFLRFLENLIRNWGGEALPAESIQEARAQLERRRGVRIAMVVADMQLGERESGLEAIAMIRTQLRSPRLPAMLLTGDLSTSLKAQAIREEIALVRKPLAPPRLLREIQGVLAACRQARDIAIANIDQTK